jgi:ribosomal protein S18 acetylase RimI-like enzyme
VYVAASWRRSGLGRALLERLIQEARADGLVLLTLSVTVGNADARRLYLRAGFAVYGVEPLSLYVDGAFLDEELMALRPDAAPHGPLAPSPLAPFPLAPCPLAPCPMAPCRS